MTVYLMQAGEIGPIKIGSCNDGRHLLRARAIQTHNHELITIVALIEGGLPMEYDLHKYFRRLNLRGEWFKNSGRLKRFIEEFPHNMHREDAPLHKVTFYGDRLVVRRIPKRSKYPRK